ncbi:hypothetical protein CTAYLR_006737 [Chrysophaeum taylorii]|uniref:ADF-H domain-containing protein n=1 Tax=Chrysophaeum taylorii TaxID=2483200 RepID=A0AAD7UB93_9STRA|nr:hypothetical protein CTAYLR_006737 [Chrysophaeum taylorii]
MSFANMVGTDFEGAGHEPGVVAWRIVKRKLVKATPSDEAFGGVLYTKDALVVLETVRDSGTGEMMWHVRTWCGSAAGMVVSGFVGSMAAKLGNLLSSNGSPRNLTVSHEKEGSESEDLRRIFGGGTIEYREGACPLRIEKVVAKKQIVKLCKLVDGALVRVPARKESLDSKSAYVFDCGDGTARSWAGIKCLRVERAVCEALARRIVKRDYHGEGSVEAAREGDGDEGFLEALGAHEQEDYRGGGGAAGVTLYAWSGHQFSEVRSGPTLPVEALERDELMGVVAGGSLEAFLWVGPHAPHNEQAAATEALLHKISGPPSWLEVEVVKNKFETVFFRERFYGWADEETEIGNEMKARDQAAKATHKTMLPVNSEVKRIIEGDGLARADEEDPQPLAAASDPTFVKEVFAIEETPHADSLRHPPTCELVKTDATVFDCSKMYVVRISWAQGRRHVVYTWEGLEASKAARAAAGIEVPKVAKPLEGVAHQIYVSQFAEPDLLVAAFAPFASIMGETGVLEVKGSPPRAAHLGPETLSKTYGNSIDAGASYLFLDEKAVSHGSMATAEIREAADAVARQLGIAKGKTTSTKPERAFRLGGGGKPRLFSASHARRLTGHRFVTEISSTFSQKEHLCDDSAGAFVLDAGRGSVFAWRGTTTRDADIKLAIDFACRYEKKSRDGGDEKGTVALVDAGSEPAEFAACFHGWQKMIAAPARVPGLDEFVKDCALKAEAGEASPLDDHHHMEEEEDDHHHPVQQRGVSRGLSSMARKKKSNELSIDQRLGSKVSRGHRGSLHVNAGQAFKFDEEECHVQDVLNEIHAGTADFLLYGYCGKKIVKHLAHGEGGLAAMKPKLEEHNVDYAMLAYSADLISQKLAKEINQPVYVLITWLPEGVSPLVRGAVTSHRSAVHQLFEPFQVSLTAASLDNISDDIIWEEIKKHVH